MSYVFVIGRCAIVDDREMSLFSHRNILKISRKRSKRDEFDGGEDSPRIDERRERGLGKRKIKYATALLLGRRGNAARKNWLPLALRHARLVRTFSLRTIIARYFDYRFVLHLLYERIVMCSKTQGATRTTHPWDFFEDIKILSVVNRRAMQLIDVNIYAKINYGLTFGVSVNRCISINHKSAIYVCLL